MIFEVKKNGNLAEHVVRMSPETGSEQDQLELLTQKLGKAQVRYQAYCFSAPDRITHLDINVEYS